MILSKYQLAGAKRLLATLLEDRDHTHSLATIRRLAGNGVAAQVVAERKNLQDFNKIAGSNAAMLSPDAQQYWSDASKALAYGRLALSKGCRKSELALSRKCEAVFESFDGRVPDAEKGHFIFHDLNGSNWDDRWHCCIDYMFPLLRTGTSVGKIADPMREAQMSVLGSLVDAASFIPMLNTTEDGGSESASAG